MLIPPQAKARRPSPGTAGFVLTAGQIEKVARRLGEVGQGLTKRRVETLARHGRIHPAAVDGDTRFYRLGDVLDAHKRHARNPGTPRSAT